jgi:hypothetical protein
MRDRAAPEPPGDRPPVFSTWPRAYAFVIAYLAAVIAAFYWFTAHFAP